MPQIIPLIIKEYVVIIVIAYIDHRIFRLENTLRIISLTMNLMLPCPPLYHVPKCQVCTSLKYLQG